MRFPYKKILLFIRSDGVLRGWKRGDIRHIVEASGVEAGIKVFSIYLFVHSFIHSLIHT
jgi:hypothetical protein